MAGVVQLVPVGAVSRSLVKELAEPLRAQFGLDSVVASALADPKYAYNKDRDQYHSSAILRRLATLRTRDQLGVIGLVEVDLFVPDADFVFGEADRESRSGLVSLTRLRPEFYGAPPDGERLRARLHGQAVHEVGHLLGLSHCEDGKCAMFLSNTVAEIDRGGASPCGNCRNELARLARPR